MRPLSVVAVPVLVGMVLSAAAPAGAQVAKQCLTPGEVYTEQLVRYGVFLREASYACNDMIPGSWKLWAGFNAAYGSRLAQETRMRALFFQRAFPKKWRTTLAIFDGRLVTYYRHISINKSYCEDVHKKLEAITNSGWGAFTSQSKIVVDQIHLDYKTCQ